MTKEQFDDYQKLSKAIEQDLDLIRLALEGMKAYRLAQDKIIDKVY